jgi:hypothetical protein
LSPGHLEFYLDFADQLLKYFVQTFCNLYGKDQLIYNIRSFTHLADDVRKFGVLDNISSFKYESYLGQLKKLVRSPHLPCAQLVRRVLETNVCHLDKSDKYNIDEKDRFCKPHLEGPVSVSLNHCQQYKQYSGKHCFVSSSHGDNCFEIAGKIGLIRNILRDTVHEPFDGFVLFEEFANVESFFEDPLNSKNLNIFLVNKLNDTKKIHPLAVKAKYVLLPNKQGFVVMPQMHLN